MAPEISRIELIEFGYPLANVGTDDNGFNLIYEPGSTLESETLAIRIETDADVTGEYVLVTSTAPDQVETCASYLVGKNPLERERHWSELKRGLRKYDRMGIGPLDIALWDLAGKRYDAPIHELLGTYRERLPAYASTYHADDNGGLDSPAAYADFAEACLELGYGGFKIHGWGGSDARRDIDREVETVHAVGERVGDEMDLMHDPACEYETYADALQVGRACDEQQYYWYEDPYRDGGISQHAHNKLREALETPLLLTEHVRGLEPFADFLASGATDFARADPEYDGGITGAMKRARIAEGFGLDVEVHAPGPAHRHSIAAMRNANYYEIALVHPDCPNTQPPVYEGPYSDQLDAVDADGTVPVPDGPGLGVAYDWDYIDEQAIDQTVFE
ncbi:enolase C-terminal domain-like protein [Halovivax cerinus]|uniref:glucarate dehydratase n=1 Tax=Halovivax cerinus TaxID=1487865 RepID=A0ABD5NRQ7_9EURY|nr:enolase C-terminal domain-like protein [Halovivax cerinus]